MIDRAPVWAGVLGGLLAFALLNALAMARGIGGYEYPLDDPYIHLAMADQIARGGYGVNAGELASAASSPLYPLLFAPFTGTDIQRWLPLIWNTIAIAVAGGLMGWAIAWARWGALGIALAAVAPFALNMYVTAYTGMENMLHGAASMMIVVGLWLVVEHRRVGWLLIAGALLAPALRLEGLALALAAGGAVVLMGHIRAGLGLMVLALAPVALFSGILMSLGLDPLPNSVIAKLAEAAGEPAPIVQRVLAKFLVNSGFGGGRLLMPASFALLLTVLWVRRTNPRGALFGLAVAAAGLAHLAIGNIGWMDRYENYILISVAAALALLLARASIFAVLLVASVAVYLPGVVKSYQWNMRAMQLQQVQMARFVHDYAQTPVAVNDLGHVVWRNPNYVLDLWGLASKEALQTRLSEPPQGWGAPLAEARNVPLAIIYDTWLGDAVGDDWVKLGTLSLSIPGAFIGGANVAFFATAPEYVDQFTQPLADWAATLPQGASFTFEGTQ